MPHPKLTRTKQRVEFGDFQTPCGLAKRACDVLQQHNVRPVSLIEPTCGKGNLLIAALKTFPTITNAFGLDINSQHVHLAQEQVAKTKSNANVATALADFFTFDWKSLLDSLADPLLIVGNPPWVTNAELGRMGSSNLPEKTNFRKQRGIDALTGKSNFDISEWMLLRMCEWLNNREACLAMICKTSVARKVLCHCWSNGIHLKQADLYRVDSMKHFGASVEACFLILHAGPDRSALECSDYAGFEESKPTAVFGFRDGDLIADVSRYEVLKDLQGENRWQWRSGIKHDCAKVFELCQEGKCYRNGLGQLVELEPDYLYPLLKSSDLANGVEKPSRWMLVPQKCIGEPTTDIQQTAPKTWQYLMDHQALLEKRGSSIYKGRPSFSIFGIGEYTFSPWKIAISGLYKSLRFRLIGPLDSRPVVFDDTCYFLACEKKEQAEIILELLNTDTAKEFFSAFVFWDAKRPVTAQLLGRLDFVALAKRLGFSMSKIEYLLPNNSHRHRSKKGSEEYGLLPF